MAFSSPTPPALRALPALAALAVAAALVSGCAHARAARPEPARAPSSGASAPPAGRLDPSEEITPEELATIPEPPGTSPRPASVDTAPPKAAAGPPEPRSTGEAPTNPTPASSVPSGPWTWRVQILATPDRGLAERVAREAGERLGTVARVDSEPPLHKVRLGAFISEADAQVLKERAVEMGYPGAFRIKISTVATDE